LKTCLNREKNSWDPEDTGLSTAQMNVGQSTNEYLRARERGASGRPYLLIAESPLRRVERPANLARG
jgi:hypothetical protein